MKRIRNIFLMVLALTTFMSCQDWLDVDPKSEIKSDLMFESESGFRDALNGVYILMRGTDLYGQEATWGFVDAIGQQYDVYSQSARYYQASRYNYNQTASVSDGIWSKSYKAVANINNMLENIDKKQSIITPTVYGIYKGEALGLRAFLHFDLLRMFGWGDLENNPANLERLCIPYITEYSKGLSHQLKVGELLPLLEKDLKAAIELLDVSDPYGEAPKYDDYYLPNDDKYFDKRESHFNYWAAMATLARVYMWYGKKAEALELVRQFIDAGKFYWVSSYSVDSYYEKNRDITFTPEHVFYLDFPKFFDQIKSFIDPTANDPNANASLVYHKQSRADKTFESTKGGNTDYRYRRQYNKVNQYFDGWAIYKFWEVQDYTFGKRVPLIKKPELYYMAAECLLATGKAADKKEAIDLMNTVRYNRGIAKNFDLPYTLEANQVQDEITKEYQKEFMCEGQLFYYYKRLGFKTIPYSTKAGSDAVYVVPLPVNDANLGGMEDYKKKK